MRFPTLALIVTQSLSITQLTAAEVRRVDDQSAVRKVVEQYVEARSAKDAKAIEALFVADADQHTTSGEWRRGRDQVVQGTLRSSTNNPGARRIDIETIRFITADVAIVDGRYLIGDGANVRQSWTMLTLKRESGVWRIGAIRNMAPTGDAP